MVQLSGGDPTVHPDIERMIEICFERDVRKVCVNTNGIRLAREPDSVRRLAAIDGDRQRLQFYLLCAFAVAFVEGDTVIVGQRTGYSRSRGVRARAAEGSDCRPSLRARLPTRRWGQAEPPDRASGMRHE